MHCQRKDTKPRQRFWEIKRFGKYGTLTVVECKFAFLLYSLGDISPISPITNTYTFNLLLEKRLPVAKCSLSSHSCRFSLFQNSMSTSAKIPSTSAKECSPQPYLSTRSEGKTLGRGLIQELLLWDIQKSGKMYLPKSSSVACSTCRFLFFRYTWSILLL